MKYFAHFWVACSMSWYLSALCCGLCKAAAETMWSKDMCSTFACQQHVALLTADVTPPVQSVWFCIISTHDSYQSSLSKNYKDKHSQCENLFRIILNNFTVSSFIQYLLVIKRHFDQIKFPVYKCSTTYHRHTDSMQRDTEVTLHGWNRNQLTTSKQSRSLEHSHLTMRNFSHSQISL